MTVEEAKDKIERLGTPFGEVFEKLEGGEEVQEALKEWFVRNDRLPNRAARSAQTPTWIGEMCSKCGGMMVQTGSCKTCQSCGQSSGGCG